MAIDFNQNYFRNSAGVQWEILGRLSLDASYPTGGYLVDPAQIGLDQITSLLVNDAQNGYLYDFDTPNSKLKVFASGGGGTFTGDPLAPHSHAVQIQSNSGTYTTWRTYISGTVGVFVVGETVSNAFAQTAVVSAVAADHLDFSSHAGAAAFQGGDTLTGGTSGATATADSGLLGVVNPVSVPLFIAAANVGLTNAQVPMPPVPTGVFLSNIPPSSTISTGGQLEGTTLGADGSPTDDYAFTYAIAAVTPTSGGTPSGIITGGGGALIEVPNGTNLSAVTNVEYRAVGL